MNFKFVGFV